MTGFRGGDQQGKSMKSNNKKLSPFLQKMKDEYLSRKVNPEIIRPEDMRDEEYLWYTIRKKWREETKEKQRLKNLEDEEEKQNKKSQSTSESCEYK